MELQEISDRIDIKLNSFEVRLSVDEYEKSIYLTRAQKAIYKEMVNIFERTEIIDTYLYPFLKEFITNVDVRKILKPKMVNNSVNIVVPSDIYMIVWEKAILISDDPKYNLREVKVLKTRIAELPYKVDNPFRTPNNKEVLRVITGNVTDLDVWELVLPENTELKQYSCKYLKDIKPIILENLPDGLSIEGESNALNTEFIDEVLENIIDLAVLSIIKDKTVVQQQNV
jgi:hypothetical protein